MTISNTFMLYGFYSVSIDFFFCFMTLCCHFFIDLLNSLRLGSGVWKEKPIEFGLKFKPFFVFF